MRRIGLFVVAGALAVALTGGSALARSQDKKPDHKPDAAAQAQAQAQEQEVQNLVRLADAAMTGQPTPSDFPIQFQNDFLKAQGGRVWVPMTLTLDPSKVSTGALTLYLRVAPRGMTAPPAVPAAPEPKVPPREQRAADHNVVKMGDDEIGVTQVHVCAERCQEQSGHAADSE